MNELARLQMKDKIADIIWEECSLENVNWLQSEMIAEKVIQLLERDYRIEPLQHHDQTPGNRSVRNGLVDG